GRFLDERCETGDMLVMEEVKELFASWRDWCNATGEYAGSTKRFSQNLETRGFQRIQHPSNRRACFAGIRLVVRTASDWSDFNAACAMAAPRRDRRHAPISSVSRACARDRPIWTVPYGP